MNLSVDTTLRFERTGASHCHTQVFYKELKLWTYENSATGRWENTTFQAFGYFLYSNESDLQKAMQEFFDNFMQGNSIN